MFLSLPPTPRINFFKTIWLFWRDSRGNLTMDWTVGDIRELVILIVMIMMPNVL